MPVATVDLQHAPPQALLSSRMPLRKLRIACIGSRGVPSNYSGVETACEGLYKTLAQRGHQVTMYCRRETASSEQPSDYYGIHRITLPAVRSRSFESLSHNAISLLQASALGKYDIIHVHALAPGCFLPICKLSGARIVATVHGLDWQRAKWVGTGARILKLAERSIVRFADQIIVVSRDLQKYYQETYGISTVYIPNGVEEIQDTGDSLDSLSKYGLESQKYLLFLGRLVPEKRVEDLIEAYRSIPGDYKLVIAGDDSSPDAYVSKLRSLASRDPRAIFVGPQTRQAVHHLFRHATLFINPAELEGLPMTVLECIQHGTPIIASDIAPHRELLACESRYDLFFDPRDQDALSCRIASALGAIDRYRSLIDGIRDTLRLNHSWERIAEQTEQVYRTALGLQAEAETSVTTAAMRSVE